MAPNVAKQQLQMGLFWTPELKVPKTKHQQKHRLDF